MQVGSVKERENDSSVSNATDADTPAEKGGEREHKDGETLFSPRLLLDLTFAQHIERLHCLKRIK